MPVRKVLLAEPRGFCAGVEMAIKALAWMVRSFPAPVYCYHEIVHNRLVVERFERLGVGLLAHSDGPVSLLAQTTLSHRDWEGVAVAVKQRFPDVWTPGRSDLCFATTN